MEVAPDYFKQVENVVKNYILVKNVRPYDHGDTLVLQDATNTKSELLLTITSVDKNSNPAREMTREIEKPFCCSVTRIKRESVDQFGNYVMWYDYKLDKNKPENREGIKKMLDYIKNKN